MKIEKEKSIEQRRKDFVPRSIINGEKPIRTSVNYLLGQSFDDFEHVSSFSETVPEQSLSIQEILSRHKRGIPVPVTSAQFYDEDFSEFSKLDKLERLDAINAAKSEVSETQNKLQQQASEAARRNAAQKQEKENEKGSETTEPKPVDPKTKTA